MTKTIIKSTLMLIGEALVIWYGMGTPIPTNLIDGIKLIVALGAITYTGYKNHDFTVEGTIGTKNTREAKALRDCIVLTADEPDDAEVEDDEESEDEDGEE